ncbi:2Fe-2S iron-sulfur cluster-binding protein [Roseococcus thiosulfatophilus]|uniref:2Fe-2S iron-sulfur cluster-binding protein n=1 Tax=Roseococcus thiosulfatophilus TaxID=35813 RepID=UPI001A8FA2DC|nr:2Fe-2S iron-sulfur cluster binding domain-containing protein [Roseococcus thiosulfatophilus]
MSEAEEPRITITFATSGVTATAPAGSSLLRTSIREKGGIPWKCGGGICGTCRCRIEAGLEHTDAVKPKERKHLTEDDFAAGYRMACQTFVKGDVTISWAERRTRPDGTLLPATS